MAEATVKAGRVVGLEDGRIWLPADVFTDPWDSREVGVCVCVHCSLDLSMLPQLCES